MDRSREKAEYLIKRYKLKLDSTVERLMDYRVDMNPKNRLHIEKFFKEIGLEKIDFETLSRIGVRYEAELKKFKNIDKDTHEFFSIALEGISSIRSKLNSMESELNKEKIVESECNWSGEYKNIASNGRLLIVDDDIMMLNMLGKIFEMNGYDVIATSKPCEVVDIITRGNIDLVMVDLIMPELDGFQVLHNIRESAPNMPVVFITGRDNTETKIEALKCGVEDYIVKPFKIEEVLARVDGITKRNIGYKASLNIDELTGAYTRKCFLSDIKKYLKLVKNGKNVSFSFLDLDRFKNINDNYGHIVGDEILKRLVTESKSYLKSGKIFRFGGDEFLIVIENKSEKEAKELLEGLRIHINGIENRFDGIESSIYMGISLGVTEFLPDDYLSRVLDRADRALYKAKEGGRNRLVAYSEIAGEHKS